MLTVKILTLFPGMFEGVFSTSILGRAVKEGLLRVETVDIRPFSDRKHRNTDDYPFGGGAGMVMLAQPVRDAMAFAMGDDFHGRRIYLGPRGARLTAEKARALSREDQLILLCGHYEGVDQRALDTCVDEEISIGDYILTGGELAAMVLTDCVARFIPGGAGQRGQPGGGILFRRAAGVSPVYPSPGLAGDGGAGGASERGPREDSGLAAEGEPAGDPPLPAGPARGRSPLRRGPGASAGSGRRGGSAAP